MSLSKPFWNNLNYASTANIREVMKFYNLGDKSFETDFEKSFSSIIWVSCRPFKFASVLVYCLITLYNTIQISSQAFTQKHINRQFFVQVGGDIIKPYCIHY